MADRLPDGRLGIVGKVHHCMVDGMAAVELAALLLDLTPEPDYEAPDGWTAEEAPGPLELVRDAVVDAVSDRAGLLLGTTSPRALGRAALDATRAAGALAGAVAPTRPCPVVNPPISGSRHLATVRRSVGELKRVARHFDATVNDVVLTAAAGGLRSFLRRRGESPSALKAMVPVNVRPPGAEDELGNQISFLYLQLPCCEPDPVRRLRLVQEEMSARKRAGTAEGAASVLSMLGRAPRPLRRVLARAMASPRAFNVTVSNIPGPAAPMYLLGCRLEEAYPVVPISDGHALSIGMSTVCERACFGIYADRAALPDADRLGRDIGVAVDELVAASAARRTVVEPAAPHDARVEAAGAMLERERLRRRRFRRADPRDQMAAYVELHAANDRMYAAERYVEWIEADALATPASPQAERFELCPACAGRFGVAPEGTDDYAQYALGWPPSARLAAQLNRDRTLGGEPPICPDVHRRAVHLTVREEAPASPDHSPARA